MKSLIPFLPLAIVLLIFNSCRPSQVATSSNPMYERDALYANSWDLAELNGTSITRSGDKYSYITFTPGTNRINGYTSCNYLGGNIAFNGANGMTFRPVVTTKKACAGNTVDASLTPALRGVDNWALVNNQLVMYDDKKVIARWSPSKYRNEKLYGNWQLASVNDNSVPFDVLYPTEKCPTLVFAADKDVVIGTTGYNTYNCPVRINSNGIAFSDCSATKMAIVGDGEPIYLTHLKNINNYTLADDNTLVFYTDDNTVLRYTRIR